MRSPEQAGVQPSAQPMTRPWRKHSFAIALLLLAACSAPPPAWVGAAYAPQPGLARPDVAALTELGRDLFFDPALSASGRTSCASCHDPRRAYGPPNDLAVQLAGRDGRTPGLRAAPSLRYLQTVPPFGEHHFDNDGDDSIDAGPTGGRMWDGRAGAAHDQARLPLLGSGEMANGSPAEVMARLVRSRHAARLRQLFGADLFERGDAAFQAALMALEVFQESPRDFYPYSSKYDQVLRGEATLTEAEARGLALFNDESKGNCASCHLSAPTPDGAFPLFTDYGLIALGLPRNRALPANADPAWHDYGLCGPLRTDFADRPEYCGLFRTPTLRNVALRQAYFHNGVYHTLEDAVRFYVERDNAPERVYPNGEPDDLPAAYRDNLEIGAPFGDEPGAPARLSEDEIADVVAFLKTLTDADLR